MTAYDIARRCGGERSSGPNRWRARCPAHGSHSATLAIAEASDRVLIKCFAGCPVDAVLAALGLRVFNLFANARPAPHRDTTPPTCLTIRQALKLAEHEFRGQHPNLAPSDRLVVSELNHIRRRVSASLGVALPPLPRSTFEGSPHERDAIWAALVEYQFANLWIETVGEKSAMTIAERAEFGLGVPVRLRIEAEERAAAAMHAIARTEIGKTE